MTIQRDAPVGVLLTHRHISSKAANRVTPIAGSRIGRLRPPKEHGRQGKGSWRGMVACRGKAVVR